jgi:malate dehydrogenase (oxaloacetate-decarboxylating)
LDNSRPIAYIPDKKMNKLYNISSVFSQDIVKRIRTGVIEAAMRTGVAGRIPKELNG